MKYHLVSWDQVCSPIAYGGLGVKNLFCSIKLYWENGCGVLGLKILICGGKSLLQNMGRSGEDGSPSLVGEIMVVGFGRASLWVGKLSWRR